jgi:hypothetical protein
MPVKTSLAAAAALPLLAGALIASAAPASADAPTLFGSAAAEAQDCVVGTLGNGGGYATCTGGGSHRAVVICGNGANVNYGPWRTSNGTRSSAYCDVPYVVSRVGVQVA